MPIQTEFEFTLPFGYQDEEGTLHREGTMRLGRAVDEIAPLRDPRVQANEAYLVVILLSRVVTRLGSLPQITPKVIENLYAADLAFLQERYAEANQMGNGHVSVTCPECRHGFEVERSPVGGLEATPSMS